MNKLEIISRLLLVLDGLLCFALSLAYIVMIDDPSRWVVCFLLFVTGIVCLKVGVNVKYEHKP